MHFILSVLACSSEQPAPAPMPAPEPVVVPHHVSLFGVLPDDMYGGSVPSQARIDLGRLLYFDPRLSKNHDIACSSCHPLDQFGVDHEPTSQGHKGARGARNAPTTYNAAFHFAQFWDGRSPTIEQQALAPLVNPVKMAMPDGPAVVAVLESIPGYVSAFEAAFPEDDKPVTVWNLGSAIGAFERGLVTPDSPFDQFMYGDTTAMSEAQVAGLDLFVEVGCVSCHAGALLGGLNFQKLGAVKPYETEDKGRAGVTNDEDDAFLFKVPSLRNVAETGPWFHDGTVDSLEDAVAKMAHHQLGKELTEAEVDGIVGFLEALTGTLPASFIERPVLPESGPRTPRPDPS